ncbi:hypothetical protein AAVH_10823 [Aphelenchoides avenae]|nr:hypothetical protein AAVH_10823 [Aphelenchus avenae]
MRLLAALLLSGVAVLATLSNADDSVDSKAVNDGRIVPSEASHTTVRDVSDKNKEALSRVKRDGVGQRVAQLWWWRHHQNRVVANHLRRVSRAQRIRRHRIKAARHRKQVRIAQAKKRLRVRQAHRRKRIRHAQAKKRLRVRQALARRRVRIAQARKRLRIHKARRRQLAIARKHRSRG